MDFIPLDLNQLFEIYNSFKVSKNNKQLTTLDIVNNLIYSNEILNEDTSNKLSKIKSITYDNEELKKLFISQQIKNYLIQELLKVFLEQENKEQEKENKEQENTSISQSKLSVDLIKTTQQSFGNHIKHLNEHNDLYDKIEQIISSINQIKIKYDL